MRADIAIVSALFIITCVVTTPPYAVTAFVGYALLIWAIALLVGIGPRALARSLAIEIPFVAFAVLLPLIGVAPRTDVLGLSVSVPGLWAAWNIVAKATLSVATMSVLRFLVPADELIDGLKTLRVPSVLIVTMSLMVRYGEVLRKQAVAGSMARRARGDDPRWFWQAGAVLASSAQLFVRSYGRSERVSLAMAARGFDGTEGSFGVYRPPRRSYLGYVLPSLAMFLGVAVVSQTV